MPHLVVHHSDSVGVASLLSALHQALSHHPTVDANAVKTRALSFQKAYVGQGADFFVHLELRLLQGRSAEILDAIKKTLVQVCQSHLDPAVVLTMEIVLMDPVLYFKG